LSAAALLAVTVLSVAFSIAQSRSAAELGSAVQETEQALADSERLNNELTQAQQLTQKALDNQKQLAGVLAGEQEQTQKALANLLVERGRAPVQQHDPRLGMLWLARGLKLAPPGDRELDWVARTSLGGLRSELIALRNILPHQGTMQSLAFSPDGR